MDAIEKRARELISRVVSEHGGACAPDDVEVSGPFYQAVAAALTPPEGYVLVPAAMTEDMEVAFAEAWFSKVRAIDDCEPQDAWAAALAVRPEVL